MYQCYNLLVLSKHIVMYSIKLFSFTIKKFVTMHGHTNVKLASCVQLDVLEIVVRFLAEARYLSLLQSV